MNNNNLKHTIMMKTEQKLNVEMVDRIKGSLMAGAAGDALGYAVEFKREHTIFEEYGESGITKFDLEGEKAEISDDTQMSLFTANGLLVGNTQRCEKDGSIKPEKFVSGAYVDWFYTQAKNNFKFGEACTWLRELEEMQYHRAPGSTCMTACRTILLGRDVDNDRKGCGGIMRVAPIALFAAAYAAKGEQLYTIEELAEAAGYTSDITHKHPLGFLPSALLAVLIYKIAFLSKEEAKANIETLVTETLDILDNIYKDKYEEEKIYLRTLTEKAICLAKSDISDIEALRSIGEGWVAEETWAVAVYCVIKHINSVEDAIIASVNHNGDSDSTGSVTGNIMGAIYGYEQIKDRNIFCPEGYELEDTLELSDIILTLAEDLATGYAAIDTPEGKQWHERYCEMKPSGIR